MIVSLFLRHGASCLVMENHKTKRMQISMDSGQNLKATAQRIKTNAGSTLEAVFNRQCVARQYIDRQWKESCCLNLWLMIVLHEEITRGCCYVALWFQGGAKWLHWVAVTVLLSPAGMQGEWNHWRFPVRCVGATWQDSMCAGQGESCNLFLLWCNHSNCLVQIKWSVCFVLSNESKERQHTVTGACTRAVWSCFVSGQQHLVPTGQSAPRGDARMLHQKLTLSAFTKINLVFTSHWELSSTIRHLIDNSVGTGFASALLH